MNLHKENKSWHLSKSVIAKGQHHLLLISTKEPSQLRNVAVLVIHLLKVNQIQSEIYGKRFASGMKSNCELVTAVQTESKIL